MIEWCIDVLSPAVVGFFLTSSSPSPSDESPTSHKDVCCSSTTHTMTMHRQQHRLPGATNDWGRASGDERYRGLGGSTTSNNHTTATHSIHRNRKAPTEIGAHRAHPFHTQLGGTTTRGAHNVQTPGWGEVKGIPPTHTHPALQRTQPKKLQPSHCHGPHLALRHCYRRQRVRWTLIQQRCDGHHLLSQLGQLQLHSDSSGRRARHDEL